MSPYAPCRRCCRPLQAPAPPEGSQNNLLALYSQNQGQRVAKKVFRPLPQHPDKILDAPELLDDYYLNLLDWGPNNVVREGRCMAFTSAAASVRGDRLVPSICCIHKCQKNGASLCCCPFAALRRSCASAECQSLAGHPETFSSHVLASVHSCRAPVCSGCGAPKHQACLNNPSDLRCSQCSWLRHCWVTGTTPKCPAAPCLQLLDAPRTALQ